MELTQIILREPKHTIRESYLATVPQVAGKGEGKKGPTKSSVKVIIVRLHLVIITLKVNEINSGIRGHIVAELI